MAVTAQPSLQFLLERQRGEHDLESDTLTAILMEVGFVFDPETHSTYSDISANEIATGYGYTQKSHNLSSVAAEIVAGNVDVSATDLTLTASGGAIESCVACCIINNTHATETVVCCIEFGVTYATPEGTQLVLPFSDGFFRDNPVEPV
jgi:hypothetical protein